VIDPAVMAAAAGDGDGGGGGGPALPRGMRWIDLRGAPLWRVLMQSILPWYVLPGTPLVRDVVARGW